MAQCNKMVESGNLGYQCYLLVEEGQTAHAGPCVASEVASSMAARARWERAQQVEQDALQARQAEGDAARQTLSEFQGEAKTFHERNVVDPTLVTHPQPEPAEPSIAEKMQDVKHAPLSPPEVNQEPAPAPPPPRPEDQPLPIVNDRPSMQSLVVADIMDREQIGIQRYGTPLQPFNGRDAMRDLYEEMLDAVVYARQMAYELEHASEMDGPSLRLALTSTLAAVTSQPPVTVEKLVDAAHGLLWPLLRAADSSGPADADMKWETVYVCRECGLLLSIAFSDCPKCHHVYENAQAWATLAIKVSV